MPVELEITRGRPEDFGELMDFLLRCFRTGNPAHERFEIIYPDLYTPAAENMAHNLLAREQGRIVGCVGGFPIQIAVDGQTIEIGGIGGVSTDPDYRGRGIMQLLLDEATRVMIHERRYSVAWLSGDRRRYYPWGFERVPSTPQLIFDSRGMGVEKYIDSKWNFEEITLTDCPWEQIWGLFKDVPCFAAAGMEKLHQKFRRVRPECRFFIARQGSRTACILPGQRDAELLAWAGDPEGVGVLLARFMKQYNRQFLIHVPPRDSYARVFDEMYVENRIVSFGSLAVLNLPWLLKHFEKPIMENIQALNLRGRCRLEITGFRQLPTIVLGLEADGQSLGLLGADDVTEPEVKLTSHELVRLLFAPAQNDFLTTLPTGAKWLAALGPLPFYLPQLFAV